MTITHAQGYAVKKPSRHDYKFELLKYELEPLTSDRVTVAVECCGVCGSDWHTLTGGWGPFKNDFVVSGHEVIGKVVEVGDKVTLFKVGDRVGVGAQVSSCGTCKACKSDNESYCLNHITDGYNTHWEDGHDHQGGYSTHVRAQEHWVYKIPDAIKSEDAASMLCGGLTVYSPLVRNGAGPGKKVGVVGLGGLGHYAVIFGAALGAEVTVFSRSDAKKQDAFKLGAKNFVATQNKGFEKDLQMEFDMIISTANSSSLPLDELLSTLNVGKKLIFVGMPEDGFHITSQTLSGNAAGLASSHLGNRKEVLAMLDLAAEKNLKPMIEVIPMKDVAKAIKAVEDSSVRYRTILIQDIDK